MTTIYDVAARAGVSPATVSKALTNQPHVSAQTRARVALAAAELDYSPNPAARNLSSRHLGIIGFIIPYVPDYLFNDPFLLEFIRGVEDYLAEQDYNLLLSTARPSAGSQDDAYRRILRRRTVDGVIVLETGSGHNLAARLDQQDYPWVTLGYRRKAEGAGSQNMVHADDYHGALHMTRYLQSLGHTRIGVISGPCSFMGALEERLRGYRAAVASTGQALDPALIAYGDFTADSGFRALDTLLDLPEPPTAIFALNDRMALGAIRRARGRGLRVPTDLSVSGFDDIAEAALAEPALTTVRQPGFQMGLRAAEMLCKLINKELAYFESVVLPTTLVPRATTAPPWRRVRPGAAGPAPNGGGDLRG